MGRLGRGREEAREDLVERLEHLVRLAQCSLLKHLPGPSTHQHVCLGMNSLLSLALDLLTELLWVLWLGHFLSSLLTFQRQSWNSMHTCCLF